MRGGKIQSEIGHLHLFQKLSRVMHDDIGLRTTVGVLFVILITLPTLFITAIFRQANDEWLSHRLQKAERQLKTEAQAFQNDLIPRQQIEKIIKTAEFRLGIAGTTAQKPRFSVDTASQIFSSGTVPEMLRTYRLLADIEPLFIVAFNDDVRDTWSWYSFDGMKIPPFERSRIDRLTSLVTAKQALFAEVGDSSSAGPVDYFRKIYQPTEDEPDLTLSHKQIMHQHFSNMIYQLPHQGNCYEIATRKMGNHKLFCYTRTLKERKKIFGGYYVTFSSRQFAPQKLLFLSQKSESPGFKRSYLTRYPIEPGQIIFQKQELRVEMGIPAELTGYNSLFEHPASLPRGLKIDFDVSDLYHESAALSRLLNLVQQSVILCSFATACFFILFGFPAFIRLRQRMLLAVSIAVLAPHIILGSIALRLLNRVETLGGFEVRAEGKSLMFRLQSYHADQKQQYLLQTLKFKQRLTEIVDLPARDIYDLHAHKVLPASTAAVLYFFRNDGFGRSFRSVEPEVKSIPRVEWLFSVKHLDNLGVLERNAPEIRKKLKMTALADGLIDSVRQEYFDHGALQYEANATLDLGKIDEFSRMIWFLVPGNKGQSKPVRAMASTNFSRLRYLIYNPDEFDQRIFSSTSDRMQHELVMGRRGHDDQILQCWPNQINPDARLKGLLDEASRKSASMERTNGSSGHYRFENQRFNAIDSTVYAGISTSRPNLVLELVTRTFPLLLLIFSLLSLLLFADILAAIFISPVKGLNHGAAAVEAGDYSQRIEIENTDEFSTLIGSFNKMTIGLEQREKMRRFVSDNLYARLGNQVGLNELRSAQISRVTMLASDIRDFTSLSEQHDPQQIVCLLNDYFTSMEAAINAYGGVIERFVGDAITAVFYQTNSGSSEKKAVLAAIAMRQKLRSLNEERTSRGLFVIENGIGIASGEATSGLVGREHGRMFFTVLGEVSRMAERLETQTKQTDSKILLCHETVKALNKSFIVQPANKITQYQAYELISVKHEVEHG